MSQDGTKGLFFTPDVTPGFDCTTDSTGFCAVGDAAPSNVVPGTVPTNNNLGYFTLTGATNTYTGDAFTLEVVFTTPTVTGGNTAGGAGQTFTAALHGTVTGTVGGVSISFASPSASLTGNCSSPSGTGCFTTGTTPTPYMANYPFTLRIADTLNISNPNTTGITWSNLSETADIQDVAGTGVPEPGSMFLIGFGLIGAFGVGRRFVKQ